MAVFLVKIRFFFIAPYYVCQTEENLLCEKENKNQLLILKVIKPHTRGTKIDIRINIEFQKFNILFLLNFD